MRSIVTRILGAAIAVGAGLGEGREASAQLFGGGVPNLAPDPTIQPMQSIARVSLGQPGAGADLAAVASGVPSQGNFLNNPLAGPIIYSTMINNPALFGGQTAAASGASTSANAATNAASANLQTAQLGMMWMMANQQNGGIGSGRMNGARPGSTSQAPGDDRSLSRVKTRTSNRPGGLSARYFHRAGGHSPYPRSYFNRRPNYFP